MGRVVRQIHSWDSLTVLEDCMLLIWSCWTLDLDFDLALTRSLSIYFYSLIDLGVGGGFWWFSRALSLCKRFFCLVMCLSLEVYLCLP